MDELAGMHVLLVDDDHDARQALGDVLASLGLRATAANSAADARLILKYVRPDAIVSDLCMPDENGFQFIAGIRKEETALGLHIPAIAISAYLSGADREVAFRAGFDAFVQKPFELEELSAALTALLVRPGRPRPAPVTRPL
jgi:two-component system OmpR family response regulator